MLKAIGGKGATARADDDPVPRRAKSFEEFKDTRRDATIMEKRRLHDNQLERQTDG